MTLDGKEKDIKNGSPVDIEVELDINPSSITIEGDGSVSEPSFSSDAKLSDDDKSESSTDDKSSDTPDKEEPSSDDDFETLDEPDDSSDADTETTRETSKEETKESSLEESKEEKVEEPVEEADDKSAEVEEEPSDSSDSVEQDDSKGEDTSDNDLKEDSSSNDAVEEQPSESEVDSKDEDISDNDFKEDDSVKDTTDTKDTTDSKDEAVSNDDLKEDSSSKDTADDSKDTVDSKDSVDDSKDIDKGSKEEPSKEDTSSKDTTDTKDNGAPNKKGESSGKEGSKDDKGSKDSKGDKGSKDKPGAKDAADKAKDKANDAKDAAKDKAKDAANAAKDKAKDAVKDKAAGAGGAKNPANMAKTAKDAKEAIKDPKKAGHVGIRLAAELPNPYSKAIKGVLMAMDAIMGKAKVDQILDKVGMAAIKAAITSIIMAIIAALMPFFLLILMLYMIFAPMLENIEKFDEAARKTANTVEKFKNLYINHNFGDSKEVFWEEIDRLDKIYGDQLDETLLMATVFYPDIKSGYKTRYDNIGEIIQDVSFSGEDDTEISDDDADGDKTVSMFSVIVQKEIESLLEESDSTYDPATGLSYSTGKILRLRNLAGNMFASTFLGDVSDYDYEEVTLQEWLDKYSDYFGDILNNLFKTITVSLATVGLGYLASFGLGLGSVALVSVGLPITGTIAMIASLVTAAYTTYQAAKDFEDFLKDFKLLINCFFMGYMSIKSIDLSELERSEFKFSEDDEDENYQIKDASELTEDDNKKLNKILSNVKIKYYKYKYSEENYKRYLREVYIPKSPEFEPYLSYDADGKPTQASIENIINDIYEYKYYFEKLFYIEEEDDSEDYSKFCLGAIDRKLSSAMSMPVDVPAGRCIEFLGNNAYGYTSSGVLHNGIELNEQSTGNVAGDKVYSVMDGGTVKASSKDSTMECTGGCLEIEYAYSASVGSSSYKYSIVYKGLSASSVTLSKGDTVTDKQEIGTIGTAEESEGVGIPSLYLEFRTADGAAIDPTNMIVKCNSVGLNDYPGAVIIDIPQDFTQEPSSYSITCLGADGWHYSQGEANNYKCLEESKTVLSPSKEVHDVWIEQGAPYKNGLAYIVVDGVERYLVAVVPRNGDKGVGVCGDVLNATLEDGTILPLVVMDTKGGDAEYEWGHAHGSGVDVIEFEVDKDVYNSKGNVNQSWGIEWDNSSPVIKFSNNGNINSGTFDLTATSSSGVSVGGGLQLCDSMYSAGTINSYVNKAIELANSYGSTSSSSFSVSDSASFIYHVLVNAGIIPSSITGFSTDTMGGLLKEYSFSRSDYDASKLTKGDIVIDHDAGDDGIAIIYLGDDKEISATKVDGVIEISIKSFVDDTRYHDIYRYNGY